VIADGGLGICVDSGEGVEGRKGSGMEVCILLLIYPAMYSSSHLLFLSSYVRVGPSKHLYLPRYLKICSTLGNILDNERTSFRSICRNCIPSGTSGGS
jgi:hypothetical protein